MPTITMFAGPNGSGKSTIKQAFDTSEYSINYINADEIEQSLNLYGFIDLSKYSISISQIDFIEYLKKNSWENAPMMSLLNEKRQKELLIKKNKLIVSEKFRGGYTAALISDFLRHRMLDLKKSFSFETVMSHKSKIEIIQKSKTLGYTVNLIFVSTNNPSINVERVNLRVQKGGHNVDEQKICDRYYRCMDLLFDAFLLADNAYVFDNSYMKQSFNDRLVATKTGKEIVLSENVCEWFEKYVLDKINKK